MKSVNRKNKYNQEYSQVSVEEQAVLNAILRPLLQKFLTIYVIGFWAIVGILWLGKPLLGD